MNTKVLTICLLVIIKFGGASGQANVEKSPIEARSPDPDLLIKYQKMESNGMTMTAVGSILFVVGVVTLQNSSVMDQSDNAKIQRGTLCTIAGMACLGPGIPMWIVGAKKRKKLSKLQTVTVKTIASTQYQGVTLSVRF